ncbi:hypothetical protein FNF31_07787 [Cafeteria roenbergensis]|uniref:Uncharacterized protein n=1 Tax=Cafeteria roenbergensis TaxID=33653 RepID=A0A5A8C139_CAFRO|nr:hypothetical protein FNF31_07787 [Cafeteria roenbergensis]
MVLGGALVIHIDRAQAVLDLASPVLLVTVFSAIAYAGSLVSDVYRNGGLLAWLNDLANILDTLADPVLYTTAAAFAAFYATAMTQSELTAGLDLLALQGTAPLASSDPLDSTFAVHRVNVRFHAIAPANRNMLDPDAPCPLALQLLPTLPLNLARDGAVPIQVSGDDLGLSDGDGLGAVSMQVGYLLFVSSLKGNPGNTGGVWVFRLNQTNAGEAPILAHGQSPSFKLPLAGNPEGLGSGHQLFGRDISVVRIKGDLLHDDFVGRPQAPQEHMTIMVGALKGPFSSSGPGGLVLYRLWRPTGDLTHLHTWSAESTSITWDGNAFMGVAMTTIPAQWAPKRGDRAAASDVVVMSSSRAKCTSFPGLSEAITSSNAGVLLLVKLQANGTVGPAATSVIGITDGSEGMPSINDEPELAGGQEIKAA